MGHGANLPRFGGRSRILHHAFFDRKCGECGQCGWPAVIGLLGVREPASPSCRASSVRWGIQSTMRIPLRNRSMTGMMTLQAVRSRFGEGILTPEGRLDRAALARVVFADSSALNDLNALVHPAVARDFAGWRDGLEAKGVRLVFREAAIPFESGSHRDCEAGGDSGSRWTSIHRVRDRSGLAEAEVRQRMARQWSQDDVMAECDAVIVNDGVEPLVRVCPCWIICLSEGNGRIRTVYPLPYLSTMFHVLPRAALGSAVSAFLVPEPPKC